MGIAKARRTLRQIGSVTTTWDVPSAAAGSTKTEAISVTGAKIGDAVLVSPAVPAAGLVYGGYVSGASTVTLTATNCTASTVDAAATDVTVLVFRP